MSERWRVLLLDTKECNYNHYIAVAIQQALLTQGPVESVHLAKNADALNLAVRHRCNLLLAYGGEGLDKGICGRLSVVCGRSALWLTEDPWLSGVNAACAHLFDRVFTNDSSAVGAYPGGAEHLPLAASRLFHHYSLPDRDEGHYLYDVLFMGMAWENRVHFLKDVLGRLNGVKAKIALASYDYLPAWDWQLTGGGYTWRVPSAETARHMVMFANRSRVTLTLHRTFSGGHEDRMGATPGPRLFETALAGGFQLVDLSLPEIARYFDVGTEIDGFRSAEECASKIHHYLQNPGRRLAMARAAQGRCLSDHLYEHRVARILSALQGGAGRARPARATSVGVARAKVLHVLSGPAPAWLTGRGEAGAAPAGAPAPTWALDHLTCRLASGVAANGDGDLPPDPVWLPPGPASDSLLGRARESSFAEVLHRERVDLVHFHGLPERPASLPLVARTLGIPTVISLGGEERRAGPGPSAGEGGGPAGPPEVVRRNFIAAVLQNADALLFPDGRARDEFDRQFLTVGRHGNCHLVGPVGGGGATTRAGGPAAAPLPPGPNQPPEAVARVYLRLLDEYRVQERAQDFFAERPLPCEASAYNVYQTAEMEGGFAPAAEAPPRPALVPRLGNVIPYWKQYGTRQTFKYAGGLVWGGIVGRLSRR